MNIENYQKTIKLVILVVYLVGLAGLSLPATRPLFQQLTPLNLLFAGGLLLLFHRSYEPVTVLMFAIVLLGGFFVEMAGVQTGLVFGDYVYGDALGWQINGTPLLIGVNWLMLIYMVNHLLQGMKAHIIWKSIAGALMMVAYDLLLEPVAVRLDFWQWGGGAIPLRNYLAWFVISFLFLIIWNSVRVKTTNPVSNTLLTAQLTFFLVLNLTL